MLKRVSYAIWRSFASGKQEICENHFWKMAFFYARKSTVETWCRPFFPRLEIYERETNKKFWKILHVIFAIGNLWFYTLNIAKLSIDAVKLPIFKWKDNSGKYALLTVGVLLCTVNLPIDKIVHSEMEVIVKQLWLKIEFRQVRQMNARIIHVCVQSAFRTVWTLDEQFGNFERFTWKV